MYGQQVCVSFLRQLTTWHCSTFAHLLLSAGRAAFNRHLLVAGPTAANPPQAAEGWQTDGRTTDAQLFHRICSAYNASNINKPKPGVTPKDKKLSYRRVTARCVLSVVISPITTQQCRNYLYDKSWPSVREYVFFVFFRFQKTWLFTFVLKWRIKKS